MAVGTPIGGVRVDLTLNSASFIRDIAKTNAAIAGSTRQMTSSLNRLQKASQAVGATFGAWITVRSVRRVINFLDQSIDLAAKLDSNLGRAAKAFQNQAEAMSNAFKLGVAQGFMSSLQKGLEASGISLEQLATAGIILGNVLGEILTDIVNFFTHDIPEGVKTSISAINSVIQSYNDARRARDLAAQQGSALAGGAAGSGLLGGGDVSAGIPLIDTSGIESSTKAWIDYADAAGIARDALSLTTQAQEAQKKAMEEANRIQREQESLFASIATPMEQYAFALKAIADAHVQGEMAARLHQAAVANLVGDYLQLADNVGTALGILFKDSKAVAIAQAVINTAQAITKTFAQYGATPWGFALAASMAAIGAAQIAAIVSAQPGSGKVTKSGGGKGKSSGGGGASSAPAAAGAASTSAGPTTTQQAINITLQGESGFSREQVRALIAQLNEAVGDGAVLKVNPR